MSGELFAGSAVQLLALAGCLGDGAALDRLPYPAPGRVVSELQFVGEVEDAEVAEARNDLVDVLWACPCVAGRHDRRVAAESESVQPDAVLDCEERVLFSFGVHAGDPFTPAAAGSVHQCLDPVGFEVDDLQAVRPVLVDLLQGGDGFVGFEGRDDEQSFAGVVADGLSPASAVTDRDESAEFVEVSFGSHAGLFDRDHDGGHGSKVRLCSGAGQSQGAGA